LEEALTAPDHLLDLRQAENCASLHEDRHQNLSSMGLISLKRGGVIARPKAADTTIDLPVGWRKSVIGGTPCIACGPRPKINFV
jgi:hypothetical protein